ncbi:MAG: tetratricopeptide repeat protein [Candidatus Kapabacteria bacterium]|nr:tetratricopeptide repeat protein [Candidatus Kapabacteria bacterium]
MKKYLLVFLMLFEFQVGYSQTIVDLNEQAESKLKAGDYDKALELYNKILAENPAIKDAYVNRAKANFALEKIKEAYEDCQIAIKLNTNTYDLYIVYARINLHESIKQYDEAMGAAFKAEEITPNSIDAKILIGVSIIGYNSKDKDYKKYKLATEYLNEAIKLSEAQKLFSSAAEANLYLGFMSLQMFAVSRQEGLRSAGLKFCQNAIKYDSEKFGLKAKKIIDELNRL